MSIGTSGQIKKRCMPEVYIHIFKNEKKNLKHEILNHLYFGPVFIFGGLL